MAEIKDIYSLEFNSSQFASDLDSAISKIEELQSVMDDSQASTEALAEANENLVSVLGTEAKGITNLNQKRDVLVKTQQSLNKESTAYNAIGGQLNNTNKQIATSTGNAVKSQKSFASSLLGGVRSINSMRRAAGLLASGFRLLSAAIPFGLILSFAGPVLSFFTDLFSKTKKTTEETDKLKKSTDSIIDSYVSETKELNNLFGALNEANKGRGNKQAVIAELQKRYPEYLKNIDLEKAGQIELAQAYRAVATEIARKVIAAEKSKIQEESIRNILKLEKETQLIAINTLEASKKRTEELRRQEQIAIKAQDITRLRAIQDEISSIESDPLGTLNDAANKERRARFNEIQGQIKSTEKELLALNQTEASLINLLVNSVDVSTLTGKFDEVAKSAAKSTDNALNEINRIIKETEDVLKLRVLQTEENTEDRINAEIRLINTLESLNKQYAKQLGLSDAQILIMEIDNIKKREKIYADYYKLLENRDKEYQQFLENSKSNLDASINELKTRLNAESEILQNERERQLNIELTFLEQKRNVTLKAFEGNAEEQEKINKAFDERRREIENEFNTYVIQQRIDLLKKLRNIARAEKDESLLSDIDKQISELELKHIEHGRNVTENTKKTNDKLKELVNQSLPLVQQASDAVFSVLQSTLQAYIQSLDTAVNRSQSALDEIRQNSEDFNARQLELERDRLEKLHEERRKAVEREKALALIQLTVNSTLAIAKAAAEGGPAAPYTIASTLIALLAGFAAARAAAGSAFFHGTEFVDKENRYKSGLDTVPAWLNKGEAVLPTQTNKDYRNAVSAIYNRSIPADVINQFVMNYKKGNPILSNPVLLSDFGVRPMIMNVGSDNSRLESRLERIENAILGMPTTNVTVKANAVGIFKIVESKMKSKNFSNNRAK